MKLVVSSVSLLLTGLHLTGAINPELVLAKTIIPNPDSTSINSIDREHTFLAEAVDIPQLGIVFDQRHLGRAVREIGLDRLLASKRSSVLPHLGLKGFCISLQTLLNKNKGIKFLFLKISSKLFPNLSSIAAHRIPPFPLFSLTEQYCFLPNLFSPCLFLKNCIDCYSPQNFLNFFT